MNSYRSKADKDQGGGYTSALEVDIPHKNNLGSTQKIRMNTIKEQHQLTRTIKLPSLSKSFIEIPEHKAQDLLRFEDEEL